MTALTKASRVWICAQGSEVRRALAAAFLVNKRGMVHVPAYAQIRYSTGAAAEVGLAQENPALCIELLVKTEAQERVPIESKDEEIVQIEHQRDADCLLAILRACLCYGRVFIRSRVGDPAGSLRVAQLAVATGLILPPTEARLSCEQSTGRHVVEVVATTRVLL